MGVRLVNLSSGKLSEHNIGETPPYLAASHAWSEGSFPINVRFTHCPGAKALRTTAAKMYPNVHFCWVDTICIKQDNEADKHRQIPLMGRIFGDAAAVVVILGCSLVSLHQETIDVGTTALEGAISLHTDEKWDEEGRYWQYGPGRKLIIRAMSGLAILTKTAWATRIWTLQEYVLAREIVWIGTDANPLVIADILFAALTDVCDTLSIEECLGGEFSLLYSHFTGMVNCRLKRIDRTRIMELLGNRSATVPVDEVYGVMAASGIEIPSSPDISREQAWAEWWQQAVRHGQIRWLHMPIPLCVTNVPNRPSLNCLMPDFHLRHKLSSSSMLDHVAPLGRVSIEDGTVKVTGRVVGKCQIVRRLGQVHERPPGRLHRHISLILFARGRWRLALRVATAFGGGPNGRYLKHQLVAITQVLVNNYARAVHAVAVAQEEQFRPKWLTLLQRVAWTDFMQYQMGHMLGVNDSVAYLARISTIFGGLDTIIGLSSRLPSGDLEAISLGGTTNDDNRRIFMVVERAKDSLSDTPLHKAAMTLPIGIERKDLLSSLSLQEFQLGGYSCPVCRQVADERFQEESGAESKGVIPGADLTGREIRRLRKLEKRFEHGLKRQLRLKSLNSSPKANHVVISFRRQRHQRAIETLKRKIMMQRTSQ